MALPALKKGSVLLQASECRKGVGSGAFYKLLVKYKTDWKKFLTDIEANKDITELDQWEFQMLCRVLDITGIDNLHFLSEGIPQEIQQQLYCSPVEYKKDLSKTIEEFILKFAADNKKARIAVIPSGPYTILRDKNKT